MPIVSIVVDRRIYRHFDYVLEAENASNLIGKMAIVPFGKRTTIGIIINIGDKTERADIPLKKVATVLEDRLTLPLDWLELVRFSAQYYQYPLGSAIFSVLPPALKKVRLPKMKGQTQAILYHWRGPETLSLARNATRQHALMEHCQQWKTFSLQQIRSIYPNPKKIIKLWIEKGWLEAQSLIHSPEKTAKAHTLTEAQKKTLETLASNVSTFNVTLLHGITGSGKTEVYLEFIQVVLQNHCQVLVMVPEINLTPQTEQRFRERFPHLTIATLHSNMAETKRLAHWWAASDGKVDIILGTRLSVFTPMPKLGLIIVDEEHDSAYKQFDKMGYHARDLAIWRAKQKNIPIVLGSATPSFESYAHAQNGRYLYLTLTQRPQTQGKLPSIELIDLHEHKIIEGFTKPVIEAIDHTLAKNEQILIFLNRRGFAPMVFCPACDWKALCPACDLRLVYHRVTRAIHCHHCGYRAKPPKSCPDCGNQDMTPMGIGTQRLEETLSHYFPSTTVLRIDRDTTTTRKAFEQMRSHIQSGESTILVGTQMLAKGHDFPNLTLVVIIDADQALYAADYRATERLFSTLMQVSGRAGRADKPGRVLIQTRYPKHEIYQALVDHDYKRFAESLLKERKQAGFPPYGYQALLRAEAESLEQAIEFLRMAANTTLRATYPQVFCYDPVPMLIAKKAYRVRAQLLVESFSRKNLQVFLSHWRAEIENIKTNVRWRFDVDPFEF